MKEGSLQGVGTNEEEHTARDEEDLNYGPSTERFEVVKMSVETS